MNITDLSKTELINNSENLVKEFFAKNNYSLKKIIKNNKNVKYIIKNTNETYNTKIISYRYNNIAQSMYAYITKHNFDLEEYQFLILVLYYDQKVYLLKIPSSVFKNPAPNSIFKNRDYIGAKSLPEYGIQVNRKNISELLLYKIASSNNPFSLYK
ncbi:MAG: hypothetical protein MJ229_02445 [bacterium]|nr:hypothetical protein [bacterium]